MKSFATLIFSIVLFCCHESCNEHKSANGDEKITKTNQVQDLKAGGLYVLQNRDSTYYIAKILVIDNDAVHMRMYSNTFQAKPHDISSDTLTILIGHAPMDKNGFLKERPELIKMEEVKDSELEGYKLYKEEMTK